MCGSHSFTHPPLYPRVPCPPTHVSQSQRRTPGTRSPANPSGESFTHRLLKGLGGSAIPVVCVLCLLLLPCSSTICNMAFNSMLRLERHVAYSVLHARNVERINAVASGQVDPSQDYYGSRLQWEVRWAVSGC